MLKRIVSSVAALLALTAASEASAGTLTLANNYALGAALASGSFNYHPQGMGYDESANELLFVEQGANSIIRTDLAGNVLGTRTIGNITFRPDGSSTSAASYVVSVAADAGNYYFSDYTNNSGGFDLYKLGKTSGGAAAVSSETAAYGGYPIDVRGGQLYRAEATTNYDNSTLHKIRVSSLATPDTIAKTLTLSGAGIGDFTVDLAHNSVWVLDYLGSASIRRFDLSTGALMDSFGLGLDGLDAGLSYANNQLYYYDWRAGSGSTLKVFNISGVPTVSNSVPEPASLGLLAVAFVGAVAARRRVR